MSSTDTLLETDLEITFSENSPSAPSPTPMPHGPPKHKISLVSIGRSLRDLFDDEWRGDVRYGTTMYHVTPLITSVLPEAPLENQPPTGDRDVLNMLYDILDVNIMHWDLTH